MGLSDELISQFAKITNDQTQKSKESTSNGTIVEYNGRKYVRLDGSEFLTPITTMTSVDDGDRVSVSIKNHTATVVGNTTSPSAKASTVETIGKRISEFEIIIADKVSTKELDAQTARIDILVADNVTIKETLTANSADITDLQADNATIKDTLTANEADIDNLKAENATITGSLDAASADIESLQADNVLIRDELVATNARIDNITAIDITTEYLEANYAQIDFANVEVATIKQGFLENLMVSQGIIADRVVGSEVVATDVLTGVKLYADDIVAGTLSVERLILRGSEDSLVYALNNSGGLESTVVDTLNGALITEKTITADHIVAGSITSTEIDVKNLISTGFIGANKLTANNVDVNDLFAQNIVASGSIQSSNYVADTSGMKITMSTGAWDSKYFKINSVGAITATSGTIGGWEITSNYMRKLTSVTSGTASTQYRVLLNAPTSPITSTVAFSVHARNYDGDSTYGSWSNLFYVRYDGYMYSTGGGKIGGWNIGAGSSGALYNGTNSKSSTTAGIYIGKDAIRAYNSDSAYTHIENGVLTCIGANIKGNIYANTLDVIRSITFYDSDMGSATIGFTGDDRPNPLSISGAFSYVEIHGGVHTTGDINGNKIYALGWFRSTGKTGWYSQTYGGGIYMADTDWVRVSHNKCFLVDNIIRGNNEIQTTGQNSYRMVWNSYGTFWRNDGSNLYLMITNSGDQYGGYGNLRPFTVNFSNGAVTMLNSLKVANGIFWWDGSADRRVVYSHNNGIYSLASNSGYMELSTNQGAKGLTWWDSDARLKKNIESTTENALEVINKIQHYSFDWKDENHKSIKVGYVAQQLEEVDELFILKIDQTHISEENDCEFEYTLQVDQTHIIPYITKSIQELYQIIQEQAVEIKMLKQSVQGGN